MRLVKVILLLMSLGALAGAVMGLVVFLGLLAVGRAGGVDAKILGAAAGVGALVGGVAGPLIALTFLRRVPIWRATVETAAAAALGAGIGLATNLDLGWLYFLAVFALLAAVRLHFAYRKRRDAAPKA